ncbi:MAG: hypothetical protein B6245_16035 [Desulfobacteraceae bacterium 4572_88]|nr:MAG: hypothetical protein B6245_16035 [Desulfobacteraceae bacterium 4572_88]
MNNSLRVVMITHGYYPRIGGAERQLAALTPLLQEEGIEVHVITRRDPGLLPFERIHNVPVYRLPVPGPKLTASAAFTLSALNLLRHLKPDIIHAHGLDTSPARIALIFKCLTNRGVFSKSLFEEGHVSALRTPPCASLRGRFLNDIPVMTKILRSGKSGLGDIDRFKQKPFGKKLLPFFLRNTDAFVAISREIDAELALSGVPKHRRVFIPNGVDTNRFRPLSAENKTALKKKMNISGSPVLIFTGRISPEKRIRHLLRLWPVVRQSHPKAKLLIAGDGPERAELEESAGPGARFLGAIDDVSPYLQTGDIFVLPSVAEGLSNALLEAMSTGLAVVATDVGGASDVITHDKNGCLIPADDLPALQAAILRLSGDAELRNDLGIRACDHIRQNYALPMIAKRLRMLYGQMTHISDS